MKPCSRRKEGATGIETSLEGVREELSEDADSVDAGNGGANM